MEQEKNTLCKAERLNSKKAIEALFAGSAQSISAFPLRVVFLPVEPADGAQASILISVPKKRFKRAVKRNRVKRQVREAYRKNKHDLIHWLEQRQTGLHIAFIFIDSELHPTEEIEEKVKNLLVRIVGRLEKVE